MTLKNISRISSTIAWILWAATISLALTKMYLLYYDHEYERILASKKWVIFIDPSIMKNNWFLNNRNKYGNDAWLMKYIILPIVTVFSMIWIVLSVILYHLQDKYNQPSIANLCIHDFMDDSSFCLHCVVFS